jgi:hypothetical protein
MTKKVKNLACGGMTKKAMGGKIEPPMGPMSEKDKQMMGAKKFRKGGMSRGR